MKLHADALTMTKDETLGTLNYGSAGMAIEFDDRTLAHLQMVIGAKLRRNESLFFSWLGDSNTPRGSIWVSGTIPLFFSFSTPDRHPINRVWLEELVRSANSPQGLYLTTEPTSDGESPSEHQTAPAVTVESPGPGVLAR